MDLLIPTSETGVEPSQPAGLAAPLFIAAQGSFAVGGTVVHNPGRSNSMDLDEALKRGWGGRDAMAATLLQQERAGIEPFSVPVEQINAVIAARGA